MARVTIDDIAREAGVSRGAVSFALNGRPGVSEATRDRILRVAARMNWRPHSAARALGGARAGAIGLVVARPARTIGVEPFFGQLLAGLQDGLSAQSMSLNLMIVEDTAAEIEVYRRWASENRVDAFVVVDPQVKDPRFAVLEELDVPAVVIGGPLRHPGLSTVWADDREAMLGITEYLAALGHRRIAHLAGMPAFQHTRRRMRALRDGARRLGLAEATSIPTDFSDAQGAAATRTLLSAGPGNQPTAIIYDSDVMAVAGLAVATEMGVPVPERLSVVSFEDSVLTRIVHPPITSLTRDVFALGQQAARSVLEAVSAPSGVADLKTATPALTVRGSTAPPPGVRKGAAEPEHPLDASASAGG